MADFSESQVPSTKSTITQLWSGLVAVSGAISSGIILGFSAVSLPQLTDEANANSEKVYLTSEQASWFASLPAIVAPIGCLLCGPLLDRFGRKACLLMVNGPVLLGWILLATVAQTGPATGPGPATLAQLYSGRVFGGLAVGMASIPGTVYLAEIASTTKLRSMLVTWTSIAISFGILLVYVLGAALRTNWQLIAALCAVFPLVGSITTYFALAESPAWLVAQGRHQEAWLALRRLRGLGPQGPQGPLGPLGGDNATPASVRMEFEKLKANMANLANMASDEPQQTPNWEDDSLGKPAANRTEGNAENGISHLWATSSDRAIGTPGGRGDDRRPAGGPVDKSKNSSAVPGFLGAARSTLKHLGQPEAIKPLAIMIGLFFFQQFSGIYVVIFYAVDMLVAAGVALDPYLASVLLGGVQFAAGIAVSFALRRFGRRPMSVISGLGMTASLTGLALYVQLQGTTSWIPLVAMLAFVMFGMIGFHTIPWALLGEMYPLRIKGVAAGITTCMGYVFSFVALKIYPQLFAITNSELGIFYFFALMSLLATLFVAICLPETHRKTLAEIQVEFRKNSKKVKIESNRDTHLG